MNMKLYFHIIHIYLFIFYILAILITLEERIIYIDTIHYIYIIIGFIYLTYIPGFLLITILKLDNINPLEFILYSIGLSLSILMIIGFLINMLYPFIGISRPFSKYYIVISITSFTLFLQVLHILKSNFMKNNNIKFNFKLYLSNKFVVIILLFILLLILDIIGILLLKYYNINYILIFVFAIISILPIVIEKVPRDLYPFIVWTISLSLLLPVPLLLKHVAGGDAETEYYYAKLVLMNGFWNSSIAGTYNALLRVVMLHPIYSIFLDIKLDYAFLIIHPIIYSLTPLTLYLCYRKQVDSRIAFLSTFLFMLVFPFYVILSRNTRTGLAEFYLSLFILLMMNDRLNKTKKLILYIIIIFSMIVSHHGTSFIFVSSLIIYSIIMYSIMPKYRYHDPSNDYFKNIIVIAILILFGWYMYYARALAFINIIYSIFKILNITKILNLLSPKVSYTIYAVYRKWTMSIEITRYLLFLFNISIIIGIINTIIKIIKNERINLDLRFAIISIIFFGVFIGLLLPTGFTFRMYHMLLCFLSIFSILGFVEIEKYIKQIIIRRLKDKELNVLIVSILLVVFALFSLGVISETLIFGNNDYSPNVLISKPRSNLIHDAQYIRTFYGNYINDKDYNSACWLIQKRKSNIKVYIDLISEGPFRQIVGPPCVHSNEIIYTHSFYNYKHKYIYLRTYSKDKKIVVSSLRPPQLKNINTSLYIFIYDKIYDNGGSQIYYN